MRYERSTKVGLAIWMMGMAACGTPESGFSAITNATHAALGEDPAGRISVISAAAAELPKPQAPDDNSDAPPPPTCEQAFAKYNKAFTELNGMVEWHALYSLDPYQMAGSAAAEANGQNCSLSLRPKKKDCGELLSTFNQAYQSLVSTPEYRTLNATVEWHATLVAHQTLALLGCFE